MFARTRQLFLSWTWTVQFTPSQPIYLIFILLLFSCLRIGMGTAVAQWLRCYATNRKAVGSIPASVSWIFIDIKSFRSHYGPGVDSVSNRNEYQEYLLGGKGGRCVRLTNYHHPVPLSRNLGNLTSWNLLGPSGPVTGLLYLLRIGISCGLSSSRFPTKPFVSYEGNT